MPDNLFTVICFSFVSWLYVHLAFKTGLAWADDSRLMSWWLGKYSKWWNAVLLILFAPLQVIRCVCFDRGDLFPCDGWAAISILGLASFFLGLLRGKLDSNKDLIAEGKSARHSPNAVDDVVVSGLLLAIGAGLLLAGFTSKYKSGFTLNQPSETLRADSIGCLEVRVSADTGDKDTSRSWESIFADEALKNIKLAHCNPASDSKYPCSKYLLDISMDNSNTLDIRIYSPDQNRFYVLRHEKIDQRDRGDVLKIAVSNIGLTLSALDAKTTLHRYFPHQYQR